MEFICVTLMIIIGITDSTADQFAVVGPVDLLLAVSGEDVILPCSLKPNISAVNMRVEWFRLDLKDSIVHLYEDHEDKNTNQLQSYRGRTEVFKDELQKGNTSLKLSRVKVSDEGLYKCFIQSKSRSDDITVDLRVEAVGSPPLITVDGFDGSGGLHLQCESKGWNPEPDLVWLDSEGVTLTSENIDAQRETDGFRVKHMITVYNRDSKYHCRVKLRHHMMETEIITSKQQRKDQRLKSEDQRIKSEDQRLKSEERRIKSEDQKLKSEDQRVKNVFTVCLFLVKSLLRKFAVNVTLDPHSAHPHLIVSDDGKQVRYEQQSRTVKDGDQKSNNKFNNRTCVLGNEGLTSGCFYYEVQVKGLSVWAVGVARESAERKGEICLNPENGYWMSGSRYGRYRASEGPSVPLTLSVDPQRVGVFVDYEEGRVSFYDVESMCHIYSFTDQSFNEKLYPVFGNIDFAPLIICDL
ncbi:butyrophilin subfamily 1 member A1-like [Misgurnus anguillicaudatus]|uniref:butyrophilin subfamily 1 member A1-like n=1 Tax=Misgurnus anguillicaudatus TaxID=75329 RepID=UPI003CCF6655